MIWIIWLGQWCMPYIHCLKRWFMQLEVLSLNFRITFQPWRKVMRRRNKVERGQTISPTQSDQSKSPIRPTFRTGLNYRVDFSPFVKLITRSSLDFIGWRCTVHWDCRNFLVNNRIFRKPDSPTHRTVGSQHRVAHTDCRILREKAQFILSYLIISLHNWFQITNHTVPRRN